MNLEKNMEELSVLESVELDSDISAVINAWNEAAHRLEQTHEMLHGEVRRLNEELAAKDRELARKNRLADLGLMASHIAHEVRNGLVPVTLYLSMLERKIGNDEESGRYLGSIRKSFTELDATLNDLLQFTSDRPPRYSELDISELSEEISRSLLPQFDAQKIDAYTDIPEGTKINADREMLKRAILNLLLNGIDAMPYGGELCICFREDENVREISVLDSGSGFSEETIGHAMEPFFSTKGTGTGLGLAIVSRILEAHEAELRIENRPEGGALIAMRFPKF